MGAKQAAMATVAAATTDSAADKAAALGGHSPRCLGGARKCDTIALVTGT